nr:hypothetical protein CFP56_50631 [Quercus suber]
MRSFPSELISAVVAVLLLVGDFPATSALPSYGRRKSLWHVSDSRDDPMKTVLESSSEVLTTSPPSFIISRHHCISRYLSQVKNSRAFIMHSALENSVPKMFLKTIL